MKLLAPLNRSTERAQNGNANLNTEIEKPVVMSSEIPLEFSLTASIDPESNPNEIRVPYAPNTLTDLIAGAFELVRVFSSAETNHSPARQDSNLVFCSMSFFRKIEGPDSG